MIYTVSQTVKLADRSDTLRIGSVAPDFDLPKLDGNRVRLRALGGKSVLINFFRGTW